MFTAFVAYTYLTAWLAERAGLSNLQIALVLAGFGAAGLLGIAAAARVADDAPLLTTVLAVAVVALAAIGLSLLEATMPRLLLLAVWGVAHTACVTLCQARVTVHGDEHLGSQSRYRVRRAGRWMGGGAMGCKRHRLGQLEPRAVRPRAGGCARVNETS